MPPDERMYHDNFYRDTTRSVAWELTLFFPSADRRIDYVIEANYFRPDGTTMGSPQTVNSYVGEGWKTRQEYRYRGFTKRSDWLPGTYRVEVAVNGQPVASREFQIVDQQIPESGPFLDSKAGLTWVSDPPSSEDRIALLALAGLMNSDPMLTSIVSSLPWIQERGTAETRQFLQLMDMIPRLDANLAKQIAELAWIADGITPAEASALRALGAIAYQDSALANRVAAILLFGSALRERDTYALLSLSELMDQPDDLRSLTRQPWFSDGLTASESALLSVLGIVSERAHPQFQELTESHHIETTTVKAPLGGDIQLFAIRWTPFPPDDNTLQLMREAVLGTEKFMGTAFPKDDVILFVAEPHFRTSVSSYQVGWNRLGRHMFITGPEFRRNFEGSVYHETAHYYLAPPTGPRWLYEGGADFLERLVYQDTGRRTQEDSARLLQSKLDRRCSPEGLEKVQQAVDLEHQLTRQELYQSSAYVCQYYLGEQLLWRLFELLGPSNATMALKELYLLAESEGRPVTEEEIYRTYLRHASPEKVEEFKELYRRLHGGPIPGT